MLQENGIDSPILRVLELDGVTSERTFHRLKLQRMARLLEREGMPVGALMHFLLICRRERLRSHTDPNLTVRVAVPIQ